jgi:hypothetical protein
MTDLDHDLRAARLDVDRDALASSSLDLARAVASVPRRGRGPSRRVALGVGALLIAAPTAAAAAGLDPLHTGWFGDPVHNTEDADTSEWLNICSPAYVAVIRAHQPASELPTGWSWDRATETLVTEARANPDCGSGGAGAMQQEIGVDSSYARYAICAWSARAAEAATTGSDTERERAGHALKTLANSKLNHAIDGGGIVAFDNRIADEVLAGDVEGARERAENNCEMFR